MSPINEIVPMCRKNTPGGKKDKNERTSSLGDTRVTFGDKCVMGGLEEIGKLVERQWLPIEIK